MMRKVKITRSGKATGFPPVKPRGLNPDAFPVYYPGTEWVEPQMEVNNTLRPVPQDEANLEAEKGETALIPNIDGLPAHFDVGGKPHSQGGTPLNLSPESFIFSDTRSMKLSGPILQYFGKSEDTKKKYTPAELAKQYDINKFRRQLQDPDSDPIQVSTAEKMIENYNKKLAMLALSQEAQKGFPEGIPSASMPYMASLMVPPEQILPLKGVPGPSNPSPQSPVFQTGGTTWEQMKASVKASQEARMRDYFNRITQSTPQMNLEAPASTITRRIPLMSTPATVPYTPPAAPQTTFPEVVIRGDEVVPVPPPTSQRRRVRVTPPSGVPSQRTPGAIEAYPDTTEDISEFLSPAGTPRTEKVSTLQHDPTKSGYYGDVTLQEWEQRNPEWLKSFKERHGRDFDPKKDTETFQSEYNKFNQDLAYKRAKDAGYPEELARKVASQFASQYGFKGVPKPGDPRGVDKKFGQYTSSRFEPSFKQYKEAVKATPEERTIPLPGEQHYVGASRYAPWWLQDVVKTWGSAADLLRLKKYLPWAPKLAPVLPEATFYDPTRELAQNAEQLNIGTQGAATFAGPQAYNARVAEMQGKAGENAANILGRYSNLNVGVANQTSAMKADVLNKVNQYNAATAQDLYDKTTIANQQFDNAKNQARQELRQSYIDAITNRAMAYDQNLISPHYKYDPATGGLVYFHEGSPLVPSSPSNGVLDTLKAYEDAGYSRDQAIDILSAQSRDEYNDARIRQSQERLNRSMYPGYGKRSRNYPGYSE